MKSVLVLVVLAGTAVANPHPNPFSYPYETLPEDELEVEQYVDLSPVRVARENPDGTVEGVYGLATRLQTELEFGITDRLEAGFYFAFRQGASAGTPFMRFEGVKQRLHYRISDADELPVNIGVYAEISEFQNEIEFEEKLLLAKRFGDINLVANLWVEQEWAFQDREWEYLYNPTVGFSYEITAKLVAGLEYWARGNFEGDEAEGKTVHYLGPTFLVQSGKVFLSVGAYLGLDKLGKAAVVDDPYGKVWVRTVLGVDL